MSLHDLPVELISRICDFLEPPNHLDLALTSKRLLETSHETLNYHHKYQEKYGESSDREALSFRPLLERVKRRPGIKWHIRSVEVWHHDMLAGRTPTFKRKNDNQVSVVNRFLHPYPSIPIDEVEIDPTHPEMLQVSLLCQCPKLKSIKFFSFPDAPPDLIGRTGDQWIDEILHGDPKYYPYNYFITALRICLDSPNLYPNDPKFSRLTHISIIDPGNRPSRSQPKAILPLFQLPSLKSLYLCNFGSGSRSLDDDEDNDRDLALQPGTSSVEHLFLENADPSNFEALVHELLIYPKALKTLVTSDDGRRSSRLDDPELECPQSAQDSMERIFKLGFCPSVPSSTSLLNPPSASSSSQNPPSQRSPAIPSSSLLPLPGSSPPPTHPNRPTDPTPSAANGSISSGPHPNLLRTYPSLKVSILDVEWLFSSHKNPLHRSGRLPRTTPALETLIVARETPARRMMGRARGENGVLTASRVLKELRGLLLEEGNCPEEVGEVYLDNIFEYRDGVIKMEGEERRGFEDMVRECEGKGIRVYMGEGDTEGFVGRTVRGLFDLGIQ